ESSAPNRSTDAYPTRPCVRQSPLGRQRANLARACVREAREAHRPGSCARAGRRAFRTPRLLTADAIFPNKGRSLLVIIGDKPVQHAHAPAGAPGGCERFLFAVLPGDTG